MAAIFGKKFAQTISSGIELDMSILSIGAKLFSINWEIALLLPDALQ